MKIISVLIILILLNNSGFSQINESEKLTKYVNPFIGTDYFGHTFPGATLPFAMVQLSPDTGTEGWTYASGYRYADNSIMGFSHRHFSGVGMTALGDILVVPTVDYEIRVNPGSKENPDEGYRSRFNKKDETASPGYYSVILKDYDVKAELTVTKRVGFHKYTFPEAENAHILFDLGHSLGKLSEKKSHIKIINNTQIEGYKNSPQGTVYFVAEFSKPFASYGTWNKSYKKPESGGGVINPYKSAETGKEVGLFLDYSTTESEVVMVKVAISFVNIEGARNNLETELPNWDFEKARSEAEQAWNNELAKISTEGSTNKEKTVFYTALYHSLLSQQISNDVDGKYFGMDGQVHTVKGYDFYPSFSAWDTYRSQHPLMTILYPERTNDMIKSIIEKTKHFGWLPAQHFSNIFGQGMVGDHLVPIVVDAYMKGIRDYDAEFIYKMMHKKATELASAPINPEYSRVGLEYFMELGYMPADKETESVPATMEMAYDDWCLAQMARELGKDKDYNYFMKRAESYKNVWDKETGFMRPRLLDGSWLKICDGDAEIINNGDHSYYSCFDPLLIGLRPNRHYTESNAWQYLWSVQHDAEGLIKLMGGKNNFTKKLDTFFAMSPEVSGPNYVGVVGTIGQYVQGNQPSHHVAYLYNYAGQPWKTQEKVTQVMNQFYHNTPGGICGNDDMGSLSSWYVLSAMGFYPVTPGSNEYAIGSPVFNKISVNVGNGKQFTIKANNVSAENIYIQSATLNGQLLNNTFFSHDDIKNGAEIIFEMGPEPNMNWVK
ncbi:MAG: GH92 family glycosyl hydrolase [Bacteroidota bacterium]